MAIVNKYDMVKSLVPYSRNPVIKNQKLSNVFWNCVVIYTTRVLIPIKLILKRVQEYLPLTGVKIRVRCFGRKGKKN